MTQPGIIQQLDDGTINKIAAGEVVERPAAIVREVLGNAIDAGADDIRVELEQGGKRLIRIQDNGSGMIRSDAELCFQRHATSKIRDEKDLFSVMTLGFRGEAIASIAAVSRFELLTRHKDSSVATKVLVDGGKQISIEEAGGPTGTTVTVRNIFFNIPARKKFLRTESTELSHCLEAVNREALIRPHIDLEVRHNRSVMIRSPKTDSLLQRAKNLLGSAWGATIEIDFKIAGISVSGLVSPVGVHRSSAQNASYLYVNRRYVKDTAIRRAIKDAYQGLVPKGRYPLVLLKVDLPPSEVDVNVHPAKTEVRFHRIRDIGEGITSGLRKVLQEHGIKKEKVERKSKMALPSSISIPALPFTEMQKPRNAVPSSLLSMQSLPVLPPPSASSLVQSPLDQTVPFPDQPKMQPSVLKEMSGAYQPKEALFSPPSRPQVALDQRTFPPSISYIRRGEKEEHGVMAQKVPSPTALDGLAVSWPLLAPQEELDFGVGELLPVARFADLRVIGQLKTTYILCEGKGELVIIDQHAAHERIVLHRLKRYKEYEMGGAQLLLTPIIVECSAAQSQALVANAAMLGQYGLEIDLFGEVAIAIRQVPEILQGTNWSELLVDVADNLMTGGRGQPLDERVEALFSSRACHNSIRAGAVLSTFQMMEILEDLDNVDFGVCAHGRPVAIRVTPAELEKRFHRN